MRDLLKPSGSGIESPRQILRLRRQKVDPRQQSRLGAQQACVVQNCECFIKMAVVDFEFCKLEKSRGNSRRFDPCAPQICKQLPGSLSAACTNLQPREIPACKRPPRLFRPADPFFQFIARRFLFGAIQLIELCKNQREIRVCVVLIDETLQDIVSGLRRLELQVRFSDPEERSD